MLKTKNKGMLKVICSAVLVCVVIGMFSICCFAAEATGDSIDTISAGITSIFNSVASNFSFANLVKFLGLGIGACSLIALGYIGLRKLIRMIQNALNNGRVSV